MNSKRRRIEYVPGSFAVVPNLDEMSNVSLPAFRLYVYLCKYINSETGLGFPTKKTLASNFGYKDPKQLTRYLKELEDLGVIKRYPHHRDDGSQTSNRYMIMILEACQGEEILDNRCEDDTRVGGEELTRLGGEELTRLGGWRAHPPLSIQYNIPDNSPPIVPQKGDETQPASQASNSRQASSSAPPAAPRAAEPVKSPQKREVYREDFEAFFSSYPRKVNKKKAAAIWKRANLVEQLPQIVAFIEKAKKTRQWSESKFIPHPTTFLNNEQWNDDISAYGGFVGEKNEKPVDVPRTDAGIAFFMPL